jgi:hypothetical protein
MSICGYYHEEDGTCAKDDMVCAEAECPYGLYKSPDPPDQGDWFPNSSCQFFLIDRGKDGNVHVFQCTMPDWA